MKKRTVTLHCGYCGQEKKVQVRGGAEVFNALLDDQFFVHQCARGARFGDDVQQYEDATVTDVRREIQKGLFDERSW